MGSYKPRHLKQESSVLSTVVSRKGAAAAIAAGAVVPALTAETAGAATGSLKASPVQASPAKAAPLQAVPVKAAKRGWYDVGYGSRGWVVSTLQKRLNARGYRLSVDGSFGPATRSALLRFQRYHGLPGKGRTWAVTWRKLGGVPKRSTSRSTSGSGIVNIARQYTGIPYRWGGTTTAGFDCSGFTQFVYRKAGKNLPRTASQQQRAVKRVYTPRPGDLVFSGFPAYHVSIYAGNGKIISASRPGTVTAVRPAWNVSSYGRA